jgi:hypothetical protein
MSNGTRFPFQVAKGFDLARFVGQPEKRRRRIAFELIDQVVGRYARNAVLFLHANRGGAHAVRRGDELVIAGPAVEDHDVVRLRH